MWYRLTASLFDVKGQDYEGLNKFFVVINDAAPYRFGSKHNGHKLDADYGCHFRANNFLPYFPGQHEFYWALEGTATCVKKSCVHRDDTHDYYDESKDAIWFPDWDEWSR